MVRNARPKCTLMSPESDHMAGTKLASVPDAYKVDGFVACSKFLKGFQLKEGDEVIVHPDMATLQQACDEVGWDEDKEKYLVSLNPQDVGTVGKGDWLGAGRRVHWADGHWWSFPMQVLAVRLASLNSSQRQFMLDGSDEWVLWSKKVEAAPQIGDQSAAEQDVINMTGNITLLASTTKGVRDLQQDCSANIVKEIRNTVEEVLVEVENEKAEALAEDAADAADGTDDELSEDDEEDESEDDEEDDEEEDEDESPTGCKRLKKAKKAASLAYGLYKLANQFATA